MPNEKVLQSGLNVLGSTLSELYFLLLAYYDAVKQEDDRSKSIIAFLSHLWCALSTNDVKEEGTSVPDSADVAKEEVLPELTELDHLLKASAKMKEKFHSRKKLASSHAQPLIKARQDDMYIKKQVVAERSQPKNCHRGLSKKKHTPKHLHHDCVVIAESKFQQLPQVQREASSQKLSFPSRGAESETSTDSLLPHLLEKNKKLKVKLGSHLKGEHSKSSLQFWQSIESTICEDCASYKAEGKGILDASVGEDADTFLALDQAEDILYTEMNDVVALCTLKSNVQLAELNSFLQWYVAEKVTEHFGELDKTEQFSVPLRRLLLEIGSPKKQQFK